MMDRWNAFVPYPSKAVQHAPAGRLSGLRLAVKDLFDVTGYPTAAGNPVLLAASGNKTETAPLVQTLLDDGARFVGKTNTDELAYSLIGDNVHFGMPINPRHPERIPGGSSSGSAVAVAAGLADIGLGTDTSGSVRLPAAINGVVGLRPTHGTLNTAGLRPLASSFDVPGFMTAHLQHMAQVAGSVGLPTVPGQTTSIVIAEDILHSIDPAIADALVACIHSTAVPLQRVRSLSSIGYGDLASAFVTILQSEAWESNRSFFELHGSTIAPSIAARLLSGSRLTPAVVKEAQAIRRAFRREMNAAFADGALLALPTLAASPPRREDTADQLAEFRSACIPYLCLAGLGGYSQLAFPASVGDREFSLSLIGAANADLLLVDTALRVRVP
ncbi:amidase family protein [Sinorhizobium sp. RAC02]|uniref:amidase family protein n=1 Tax=Sinorhizobium sp. RAC02 TaxID=1842534 RepID=UPI00083E412E|nr:amidase family protein [Sinorhizobium sp. RAC02]AOF92515.1 amidase family protein [Sinorhizobium sp. RAC02]